MGNFYDKKYIIRESEEILQECSRKNGKDKKENIKLQKDLKKLKKTNKILKIIIAVMTILFAMTILWKVI